MYILLIWVGKFCSCLLGPLDPELNSSPEYPCLVDLSNIENGVLKSPAIIVWESKSLYRSLRTCFMNLGSSVWSAYILSSCCTDAFTIM